MSKSPGGWISDIMRRSELNEIGSGITRSAETRAAIEHGAGPPRDRCRDRDP